MKVNRFLILFFVLLLPGLFTACDDDDDDVVDVKNTLAVTPPQQEADADDLSEYTFEVETNANDFEPKVTTGDEKWVEIKKSVKAFTVKAKSENEEEGPREVTITVTAGNADAKTVKFIQKGQSDEPTIEPDEYTFSLAPYKHEIDLESVSPDGCSDEILRWLVETNIPDAIDLPVNISGDWSGNPEFKAYFTYGTLNDEDEAQLYFKINIPENEDTYSRTTMVTIDLSEYIEDEDEQEIEWIIIQEPKEVPVDPESRLAGSWTFVGNDFAGIIGWQGSSILFDKAGNDYGGWSENTIISYNQSSGYWEAVNFAGLGVPLVMEERDGKFYFKNNIRVVRSDDNKEYIQYIALFGGSVDFVEEDAELEFSIVPHDRYGGVDSFGTPADFVSLKGVSGMPWICFRSVENPSTILCLTEVEVAYKNE